MTAMDFRLYDNALGRFHGVDLLAEVDYSGSPYSFSFNNPVYFSDPSGLTPDPPVNENNPIELEEVVIVRPPKRAQSSSPFRDMSFAAAISMLGANSGNFGIANNGAGFGGGGNEIGVTMSPMGLVALNTAVIEGARMKEYKSVGQPGDLESLIPVWGSGRAAVDYFQNGNYWYGAGYTALAISDVFLVKSVATGIGRGAWKLGSHTWGATRKWLGKNGYAESGQHVHHWLIHQATSKKYGLEAIANQPWNLKAIQSIGPFSSQTIHNAIHGKSRLLYFNFLQIGWYGTPTWFKAITISTIGRIYGSLN